MWKEQLKHLDPISAFTGDGRKLVEFLKSKSVMVSPDYESFLLELSGPVEFTVPVWYKPKEPSPWASKKDQTKGLQRLERFYGITDDSLIRTFRMYEGRVPSGCIPIAQAPGGNQILLGSQGQWLGKVYLWDHEQEPNVARMSRENLNLYLIADSFVAFIELLKTIPDVKNNDDDSGIIESESRLDI